MLRSSTILSCPNVVIGHPCRERIYTFPTDVEMTVQLYLSVWVRNISNIKSG